ncbi:MAG TPA: hypothetical protein VGS41_03315 [Chthonomonadales bacterium]|nr:hypothetical protein [Chthonomonadales bacterium]
MAVYLALTPLHDSSCGASRSGNNEAVEAAVRPERGLLGRLACSRELVCSDKAAPEWSPVYLNERHWMCATSPEAGMELRLVTLFEV